MTTDDKRRCSKCMKIRPTEEFRPHQKNWCRPCYRAYFQNYNRHSRDTRAEQERGRRKYEADIRPRRMERKMALIQLMGGQCSICGYRKSAAALEFDHLHDGQSFTPHGSKNPEKARALSHLLAQNTPEGFRSAIEEVKKCRLLCANCHREQTYPGHEMGEATPVLEDVLAFELERSRAKNQRTPKPPKPVNDRKVPVERVSPLTGEVWGILIH